MTIRCEECGQFGTHLGTCSRSEMRAGRRRRLHRYWRYAWVEEGAESVPDDAWVTYHGGDLLGQLELLRARVVGDTAALGVAFRGRWLIGRRLRSARAIVRLLEAFVELDRPDDAPPSTFVAAVQEVRSGR